MKAEEISDAIGQLEESLVVSADKKRKPDARNESVERNATESNAAGRAGSEKISEKGKRNRKRLLAHVAAAACIAAACLAVISHLGNSHAPDGASASQVLAAAKYPQAEPYPDENDSGFEQAYDAWRLEEDERHEAADRLDSSIFHFYKATAKEFLSNAGGENRVYSPANLYMALAMLAEAAGGDSKSQLLNLLQAPDGDKLRQQAKNLWTANYRDDGATTSILANSLWLDDGTRFRQDTIDLLAKDYYASVYWGDTASQDMAKALQGWLDAQTGGLLKEAAKKACLSPDTVMDLCSAIYFQAKWDCEFAEEDNDTQVFHAPGGDVKTEFMNNTIDNGTYYWGDGYSAIRLRFVNDSSMWLLLPDEGKTPGHLLASGEYLDLAGSTDWPNQKRVKINCSVPKFDISSDMQLQDGLRSLGATDIFDSRKADFTPLAGKSAKGIFVSQVRHAARVQIDEKGCTAAAFTEISFDGGAMPPEDETDFVLDRPFLFVITGDTGHPLFIGTVSQP